MGATEELGEGENDDGEQELETDREASDCEQTVPVYSVNKHSLLMIAKMRGARQRSAINETALFRFLASVSRCALGRRLAQ